MSRRAASAELQIAGSAAPQRQAVLHLQRDALRIAYLLTGDRDRARDLTARAFVELLGSGDRHEDSGSLYNDLLLAIARLDRETAGSDAPIQAGNESPEAGGQPRDDEHSRLRAALDALDPATRAALVLHDVAGIDLERVAPLYGVEPVALRLGLHETRQRLLDAARSLADEPLRRLIAGLAVGAPRLDLWPEVGPRLGEIQAERRRRNRLLTGGVIGAALLVLLGGVAWFFGDALLPDWGGDGGAAALIETATPAPTRPPRPTATPAPTSTLPDLVEAGVSADLLVSMYEGDDAGNGRRWLMAYDPESHAVSDPFGDASELFVSADGRWMLLTRYEPAEVTDPITGETYQGQRRLLSAMRADGRRMDWEFEAPPGAVQPAIVGDRLYLAAPESESAARVSAYDLITGDEIASRLLDLPATGDDDEAAGPGQPFVGLNFILFPEISNPALYLTAQLWESGFPGSQRQAWRLFQVDLDDLSLSLLSERSADDADPGADEELTFPAWSPKVTPDGAALWAWRVGYGGRPDSVFFLDLASGRIERVTIPFTPVEYDGFNPPSQSFAIPANSGRWLYVVSPATNEAAIIDLTGRRIERLFPLDTGGFERVSLASWQQALSHDGRYLYAAQYPDSDPRRGTLKTLIWVIDLSEWRIVKRLEVIGVTSSIHLSTDGSRLYAFSQFPKQNANDTRSFIVTLDVATGEVLDSFEEPEAGSVNWTWMTAAASNYRERYGRAPVIDGAEPQDLTAFTTLPRVEVEATSDVLPMEVTHEVAVRFLDPATGREITRGNGHTRLDPDLPMTLVFEHPGAKSVVTVPVEFDPGTRSGSFRPREPGAWSARVNLGDPEEGGWSVTLPDVVNVVEPLEASDGRSYYLRVSTVPPEQLPYAAEILLRAVFVEARTAEPLPEGVELLDGMPGHINAAIFQPGEGVTRIKRLEPAGHGFYEAEISLWGAGPWLLRLSFDLPEGEGEPIRFEAGRIDLAS